MSTIFWYKALRLKGSTVKGRVPVNMAYMFTPLERETPKHETRMRPPPPPREGKTDRAQVWQSFSPVPCTLTSRGPLSRKLSTTPKQQK